MTAYTEESITLYQNMKHVREYLGDLSFSLKTQLAYTNSDPILQSLANTVSDKTRAINIMFAALKGQSLEDIESAPKDKKQRVEYYRKLAFIFREHIFTDAETQVNLDEMFTKVARGTLSA